MKSKVNLIQMLNNCIILILKKLELRQAFTLFDTNRNDYLSKQEIGAVLNNLAQYPTEEELQKLMDDLDKDGKL